MIGPAKAQIARINDHSRYVIYAKREDRGMLLELKNKIEQIEWDRHVMYQFDMSV